MRLTFFRFYKVCPVFSFGVLVSVFPFFDVSGERNIRFLGVVMRVGRRHSRGSGARDPRGGRAARRARTERDGAPRALALIVARRDRKYIIAVPFNHFLFNFQHTHASNIRILPFKRTNLSSRVWINRPVRRLLASVK